VRAILTTVLRLFVYWLASKAGRDHERAKRSKEELDAVDDASAARDSLRDPNVRDELQEYRRRRDVLQTLPTDSDDRGDRPRD
jgi:hypothetical protein